MLRKIIQEEIMNVLEEMLSEEDLHEISKDTLISYLAKANREHGELKGYRQSLWHAKNNIPHDFPEFSGTSKIHGEKNKRYQDFRAARDSMKDTMSSLENKADAMMWKRQDGMSMARSKLYRDHGIDVGGHRKNAEKAEAERKAKEAERIEAMKLGRKRR